MARLTPVGGAINYAFGAWSVGLRRSRSAGAVDDSEEPVDEGVHLDINGDLMTAGVIDDETTDSRRTFREVNFDTAALECAGRVVECGGSGQRIMEHNGRRMAEPTVREVQDRTK